MLSRRFVTVRTTYALSLKTADATRVNKAYLRGQA